MFAVIFHVSRGLLSSLSLFASLSVICTYSFIPAFKTYPYKLSVILALADALASIGNLIGLANFCTAEAFITQFAYLASFLWTCVISVNIYLVLVKNLSHVEKLEPFYHAFVWGTSLLLACAAVLLNALGPVESTLPDAGLWCWITPQFPGTRFVLFYLPLIACICVSAYLYQSVVKTVYVDTLDTTFRIDSQLQKKFFRYVGIFIALRIFSILNRIQTLLFPGKTSIVLYFFHGAFSCSQGFVNACLYGLNRQVRLHYKNVFDSLMTRNSRATKEATTPDARLPAIVNDVDQAKPVERQLSGGQQVVESLFSDLVNLDGIEFHEALLDIELDHEEEYVTSTSKGIANFIIA